MPRSPRVELQGFEARYYDSLLKLGTLGKYEKFIQKAIMDLHLNSEEVILDLGAGTGKNAELILRRLNSNSKIYALEIGEEMIKQLQKRQRRYSQIHIIRQRIEDSFQLPQPATLAFISFVLHGLDHEKRREVLQNVHHNLAEGGKFCILDYNHFDIDEAPWYLRVFIRKFECKPAADFIQRDWPTILEQNGFNKISQKFYFKNYLRLLCAFKV